MVIYKYLLHTKCYLILINSTCQQLQICHWCEKTILVRDRDFHKVTRFAIGSPGLAYSSIDFFPTPHFSIPYPKPFHSVIECQIGIFFLKAGFFYLLTLCIYDLALKRLFYFIYFIFFSFEEPRSRLYSNLLYPGHLVTVSTILSYLSNLW